MGSKYFDITSDEESQTAVAQVLRHFGRVDVLINRTGLFVVGAFEAIDVDSIRSQIEVDLYGSMRMVQRVLPTMSKQRSGHIVNMSSVAGRVPAPGEVFSNQGRLNRLLPSWTDTPLVEELDKAKMQRVGFLTPLLSVKNPDEVASVIIGLLRHPQDTVPPKDLQIRLSYLLSGIASQVVEFSNFLQA